MQDIQTSATRPRMDTLDALRGVAAMIVLMTHYLGMFFPGVVFGRDGHYEWEKLIPGSPLYLLVSGHLAVCMFFVLSGFVLSVGALSPGGRFGVCELLVAVIKRPVRLLGMVAVTELVGLILWWQGWFVTHDAAARLHNTWLDYMWQKPLDAAAIGSLLRGPFFYGVRFNPPLWTIVLELYGSWLVFLLLACLTRLPRGRLPALIVVLVGMGRLKQAMEFCGYQSDLIPAGHWMLLQGFVFGMIAAQLWNMPGLVQRCWRVRPLRWAWLTVAIIFASHPYWAGTAGTWYERLPHLTDKLGGGYPMLGAFMLFMAVLAGWGRTLLHSALAQRLGHWSYAIYGTHFLIQSALCCGLYLWLDDRGWPYPVIAGLSFVLMLLLVLGCASLFTRWVDAPSIRLAARVGNCVKACYERRRSVSKPAK